MIVGLPAPRTPGSYSIALVCLGNICRSPMADVVLSARVDEAGLAGRVSVASCGSGDWHVGHPMDRRAAATLTAAGYDATQHRAQQFDRGWLDAYDLVLAMDRANLADIGGFETGARAPSSTNETASTPASTNEGDRVRLFRDFDPIDTGGEVPDPYYGGDAGFEEVLAMVERTSATIVAALQMESAGWRVAP